MVCEQKKRKLSCLLVPNAAFYVGNSFVSLTAFDGESVPMQFCSKTCPRIRQVNDELFQGLFGIVVGKCQWRRLPNTEARAKLLKFHEIFKNFDVFFQMAVGGPKTVQVKNLSSSSVSLTITLGGRVYAFPYI